MKTTVLLTVPDFEANGYVLDIGGGGEGVIGKMKPAQVVAIDLVKRELEEAPPERLKIVMDARDLKFLDNTFPTRRLSSRSCTKKRTRKEYSAKCGASSSRAGGF